MASQPIQCDMCLEENAVGSCDTCGHVGEACLRIHQKGRSFRTHIINALNKDSQTTIRIDITEERCKKHPTKNAFFLCTIHDSMVCGRCLHSEHIPCAKEVVDLEQEGAKIDCEKVNTMKALFNELKDEISLMKDEAAHSMGNYKNNADKCVEECMELGNKIKQRVDQLTSSIKDGIAMKHAENVRTHSRITDTCDEKIKWCANEENKIDDFVDNNMAGYLYLMGRHFEKDISNARSYVKEVKSKHIFKGIDFKENKTILKCLFEDLEDVCEQHEEVTGSDDGNTDDVATSTPEINKTRRELTALLNQAKHNLDQSEKTQKKLRDELKRVKQDLYLSEKTRKQFEQELLKAKQDIEKAEKTRKSLCDELTQVEQDLDRSEKERAVVQAMFPQNKEYFSWTQPTGTLEVKGSTEQGFFVKVPIILLVFTFPDGIQTTHHPSPGKPYKGGTFTGHLNSDPEGELLCRMLKAAFRRGLMFNLRKEGKVVLDGISLCDGPVFYEKYFDYTRTLKAELAAKGITEAEEKLVETFTVDGSKSH